MTDWNWTEIKEALKNPVVAIVLVLVLVALLLGIYFR